MLGAKLMGLDWGTKTIGVSVSDGLGIMAIPLETIRRPDERSIKKSVARLKEIIREHGVERIVLGYPLSLDGSEGASCAKVRDFRDRLMRNFKRMDIVLWDERLSTVYATRLLSEANAKNQSRLVDVVASCAILQSYLDTNNGG